MSKEYNILVTDEAKQALYTARYHLLTGEPVPELVLPQMMSILTPILGAPPASMWPRGGVDPDPIKPPLPSGIYNDTKWLVTGSSFPIVGRGFTREQFLAYVTELDLDDMTWTPDYVVLHATSSPTLAMRPNGFEQQHMFNLRSYYMKAPNGWPSGPHMFVDDKLIWLFTPLIYRGTHSPSFNIKGIGIEALGSYPKTDNPHSGRGGLVWDNVHFAAAVLEIKFGLEHAKYHNDDPRTNHTACPLPKSYKAGSLQAIALYKDALTQR